MKLLIVLRICLIQTINVSFARRFVPYKRPNLLMYDKQRFLRLLPTRSILYK